MEKIMRKLSDNILDKLSMDFLRNQVLKNAYGNDDTFIASLDPRILLVWYVFFALVPWFANSLPFLLGCFLIVTVTTIMARVAGLVFGLFVLGVFSQTGYLFVISLLFGGNGETLLPLLILTLKVAAVSLASVTVFSGLDAICLTEHFNTLQFEELYDYLTERYRRDGDTFLTEQGLRIFAGMETDIREGGHLPSLDSGQLKRLDFIDLNGKDVAENRERIWNLTAALAHRLGIPMVSGSDTHQAVQYGCIRTRFLHQTRTVETLYREMKAGRYQIEVSDHAAFQVKTAGILKRALKEIHADGGNYVSVLVEDVPTV